MVKTVIKRDSRRQAFSKAKIVGAVEKAAREARVSSDKRREYAREISEGVAKSLSRRSSVRSSEIRRRVLKRLESRSRAAVSAWKRHDRKR